MLIAWKARERAQVLLMGRIGNRPGLARKAVLAAAGSALLAPAIIRAQSPTPAGARFEVASIKRSTGCGANDNIYGTLVSRSPGRFTLNCATVAGLVLGAYSRYANGHTNFSLAPPIRGGPAWINSERYTISAKSAGEENRAMMNGPMLQALLTDRFRLKMHRQIRQVPVLVLSEGKTGARLKPFQEGTCVPADYAQDPPAPAPGQPPFCQDRIRNTAANVRSIHVPGATVATFCGLLGVVLGRPVIDQTALQGRFDFDIEFAIDQSTPGFAPPGAPANVESSVSIFTAVQEQLGLKLHSTKGPGEFLVIDHVERPSEN